MKKWLIITLFMFSINSYAGCHDCNDTAKLYNELIIPLLSTIVFVIIFLCMPESKNKKRKLIKYSLLFIVYLVVTVLLYNSFEPIHFFETDTFSGGNDRSL
ncbi:hypothetical protein ACV2C2_11390 [Salmonella enterica subsp. salamae serovar 42:r:-]|uniref:Inner membrane protein n=1 Tax=Salmonella enterica TaxID=28901 RepID=A0A4Q1J894_SALER|nr:hypothetical protein [Salmonella enterica]ECC9156144.1 hypothetical protein [Salmonella enterica subsp. salamae]AZT54026.1 hypothetical protein EL009_05210 [Salmonella enterica subsp. salamae serovar 42:r:-]EAO0402368.1 hypothetical protein [Salmonella enterica]EAO9723327.1 hypothetical protein [Salmonella enterica]EAP0437151.1 hypothetical protein [Salmonella enterica]